MRIVFMGTPEFAVPSLEMLYDMGHEVVGVFTQPDRPKGRGNKMIMSPVKEVALRHGTPVFQPERIKKTGVEDLKALAPDLCVTAAFGQILSQEILDIPKFGTINVHASLLPKHRGAAPIVWGVVMGDKTFGITTMLTDKGMDTGAMLLKAETALEEGETAGELTKRLSLLGAELLKETIKNMDTIAPVPQDNEQASYEPMLKKEMGIIDWEKSAKEIKNLIHGLNPWPCAMAGHLKLLRARVTQGQGAAGEILAADKKSGLIIACGQGAIEIIEIQAPGGKAMPAKAYLMGHEMNVGGKINDAV
jgi:methionyl-tRNA formyltransferase